MPEQTDKHVEIQRQVVQRQIVEPFELQFVAPTHNKIPAFINPEQVIIKRRFEDFESVKRQDASSQAREFKKLHYGGM